MPEERELVHAPQAGFRDGYCGLVAQEEEEGFEAGRTGVSAVGGMDSIKITNLAPFTNETQRPCAANSWTTLRVVKKRNLVCQAFWMVWTARSVIASCGKRDVRSTQCK